MAALVVGEVTWKILRSIWYLRTCTGAPSVTVWGGVVWGAPHLYRVLLQVDADPAGPGLPGGPPHGGRQLRGGPAWAGE